MLIVGGIPAGAPGIGPILVVDDDEHIRNALDLALSSEGYDVLTAADGAAALQLATTIDVALILLDIRMPGMDGPGFAAAYATLPGPQAPTIVISATDDAALWAGRMGAQAHLSKPFDLDDLLALVARYVGPERHD